MLAKMLLGAVAAATFAMGAQAATAPAEIKIGTLYASSGPFAAISMPVYSGLKFWVDQKNAEGGVFVKPFNKKIPIKLVAFDDQSNPATAATLYNQLITQDKVDLLVSDSGSVLTAAGVPIAREHKQLLIDQSGTGASFFSKDNPYIVLTADPVSSIWPKYLADFLSKQGPVLGIKRIALLYATNDFTGTQASAVRNMIKASGSSVQIVYDQGVPTTTTNYTVLLNNIKAANPDAVVELGYPNNDISFLRNLQDSGQKFNFVFTIYAGLENSHLLATAGAKAMQYVFTYVSASDLRYKPEFGLGLDDYRAAWEKQNKGGKNQFGFNAVAGYTTGLVLEKALAGTQSMDQLALRKSIGELAGKLKTLDGTFDIDETGAQIGEITPLGQLVPDGKNGLKFSVVYPPEVATGKPVYPAPH
jgi:branched-chain amino acid transport system substrate-binding protein